MIHRGSFTMRFWGRLMVCGVCAGLLVWPLLKDDCAVAAEVPDNHANPAKVNASTPMNEKTTSESVIRKNAESTQPIVWQYTWEGGKPATQPKASICPFKYGKRWAYAVEFDDGGVFAKTIALPLLKTFHYTDAPPGIDGGKARPFVAGVAINPPSMGGNSASLNWDDLKMLEQNGWGVIDHSYWHTGCHWDPSKKLDADQFRRELFWGQTFIGHELYDGKYAPSQFVYPNGDYNFAPYLREVGLRYGSHVGGKNVMPYEKTFDPLRVKRSYLDEGVWEKHAEDPMDQFPKPDPSDKMLFIDFTHGIGKPDTDNHKRWTQRLTKIENTYGQSGKDDLWCAPASEVLDYSTAVKSATLSVKAGKMILTLPADSPHAAMTIRVDGLSPETKLPVPEGGLVYRKDSTAWITTPPLGRMGAPMPQPQVSRVYDGPYKTEISLKNPVRLAAVRVFQQGNISLKEMPITLTGPDGKTQPLNTAKVLKWVPLRSRWGYWLLFPTLPEGTPPLVQKISLPDGEKSFKKVEIWAIP